MKTNWVRNFVFVVLGFVIASILWNAQVSNAQKQQTSLEQRVQDIEQKISDIQYNVDGLISDRTKNQEMFSGWLGGRLTARLYSTTHYTTSLEKDPQGIAPSDNDVSTYGLEPKEAIVILSVEGKEIEKVNLSTAVKPGDLLIAWLQKEKPQDWAVPYSPDRLKIPAYYWNRETGLAVAILHIEGEFNSGMIIK